MTFFSDRKSLKFEVITSEFVLSSAVTLTSPSKSAAPAVPPAPPAAEPAAAVPPTAGLLLPARAPWRALASLLRLLSTLARSSALAWLS
jgi:hypothetical protein